PAGLYPVDSDGRPGQNFELSRAAFQQSHGQPISLLDDVPPLTGYTVTDADIAGPFTSDIPPTLPDQASLDALNYRTPLEAIAERVHRSHSVLQTFSPQASFQRPDA